MITVKLNNGKRVVAVERFGSWVPQKFANRTQADQLVRMMNHAHPVQVYQSPNARNVFFVEVL